jgi:hypothetical protein
VTYNFHLSKAAQPETLSNFVFTGKVDEVGHLTLAAPAEDVVLKLRTGSLVPACPSNFSHGVRIAGVKVKCLI